MALEWKYLVGNALDVLKELPDNYIQCVVTSPPYWGLRDYGVPPIIWDSNNGCKHDWVEHYEPPRGGNNKSDNMPNVGANQHTQTTDTIRGIGVKSQFCNECGAWRGQLGLEPTPELYVQHLLDIFQ